MVIFFGQCNTVYAFYCKNQVEFRLYSERFPGNDVIHQNFTCFINIIMLIR